VKTHKKQESLEISSLTRTDELGTESITVTIYRINRSGWRLRVANARGVSAVWKKHFETEADALAAYTWTLENDGESFIKRAGSMLDVMDGFNAMLLQPRDKRYTDPKRFVGYTLRILKPIQQYAGMWPAQSLMGYNISGYLYKGDAPAWPHSCQGLPGAPQNIEVEFTISPEYIEAEVVHDLGLRPAIANYFMR
jgi:hypothetical protein